MTSRHAFTTHSPRLWPQVSVDVCDSPQVSLTVRELGLLVLTDQQAVDVDAEELAHQVFAGRVPWPRPRGPCAAIHDHALDIPGHLSVPRMQGLARLELDA